MDVFLIIGLWKVVGEVGWGGVRWGEVGGGGEGREKEHFKVLKFIIEGD